MNALRWATNRVNVEPNEPIGMTHEELTDDIHQGAMAREVARMEHAVSQDTVPAGVLEVQPSASADDVIWQEIQERTQVHFENQKQAAIRHRVDEQAKKQLEGERFGALYDAYSQGRRNPILQGEAPLHEQFEAHLRESPVVGQFHREIVPTVVPIQPPLVAGHAVQHEFTPFRELNFQDVTPGGKRVGVDFKTQGDSYESFRRIIGRPSKTSGRE